MDENSTTTTQTTEAPAPVQNDEQGLPANTQPEPTTTQAPEPTTTQAPEPTTTVAPEDVSDPVIPDTAADLTVAHPENSPTLNDVTETPEHRLAQARGEAMANHAMEHGPSTSEATNTEEEIS